MKIGEVIGKAALANKLKKTDLNTALTSVFADIVAALKSEDRVSVPQLGRFVKKNTKAGTAFIVFRPVEAAAADKAKPADKNK